MALKAELQLLLKLLTVWYGHYSISKIATTTSQRSPNLNFNYTPTHYIVTQCLVYSFIPNPHWKLASAFFPYRFFPFEWKCLVTSYWDQRSTSLGDVKRCLLRVLSTHQPQKLRSFPFVSPSLFIISTP